MEAPRGTHLSDFGAVISRNRTIGYERWLGYDHCRDKRNEQRQLWRQEHHDRLAVEEAGDQ